jgi:hypothetical protein
MPRMNTIAALFSLVLPLARVKGSHLAREREELRALLPAGRDGGTR